MFIDKLVIYTVEQINILKIQLIRYFNQEGYKLFEQGKVYTQWNEGKYILVIRVTFGISLESFSMKHNTNINKAI